MEIFITFSLHSHLNFDLDFISFFSSATGRLLLNIFKCFFRLFARLLWCFSFFHFLKCDCNECECWRSIVSYANSFALFWLCLHKMLNKYELCDARPLLTYTPLNIEQFEGLNCKWCVFVKWNGQSNRSKIEIEA